MDIFECSQCGLCCQSLANNSLYRALDRGDGICKYYDDRTKLCKIYNERPLICNVDLYYETMLKDKLTREDYYKKNYAACAELKIRSEAK